VEEALMEQQHMADAWVARYLHLLGVGHEPPNLAALTRLTRAHLLAIPFGNLSALLRYRDHPGDPPPLDINQLLAEWGEGTGTAVCLEIVFAFARLLAALGYEVRGVAGAIRFPGSHQALVVALGGARYLVDVGNGSPFFAPLPLDRVVEVRHAGLAYRLRPGEMPGEHVQDRWIGGAWVPFCRYDLGEQGAGAWAVAYRRHHLPGESFVIGPPRLVRCTEAAVHSLHGAELTHFTAAGKRVEHLAGPAAYERAAREVFGAPRLPLAEALAVAERLQ
jgi:arylamine N-acetyltransferase